MEKKLKTNIKLKIGGPDIPKKNTHTHTLSSVNAPTQKEQRINIS